MSVLLDTDQLQTNSLLSHRLGHILDHLSNEPLMREFIAPLCVKTHRYTIIGTVCIDGDLIILIQHF